MLKDVEIERGSLAAGVKPLRVSIFITTSMILWATLIAVVMVAFDLSFQLI
jgi:hypothetical protein